jgi:hypothetical protein
MGFWSRFARNEALLPVAIPAAVPEVAVPRFDVDIDSGVLYGTPTLSDYIYGMGRVSRAEALKVPAIKRARDLIAGEIGQLPLRLYDPTGRVTDWPLLAQPEAGIAGAVTWARVVEDLLFDERTWMRVAALGWHGRPVEVTRLDADSVSIVPQTISYGYGSATVWPEVAGLIRIDSPNKGLLEAGAPAIKALIALDRAGLNAATGAPPIDYFTPSDGVDPADEDVADFLASWQLARSKRATGYIPAAMTYNVAGWDPEKLQLAEVRKFAIAEIARETGIDAEDLSVSTTSRTYFNAQDRRRNRIESVLGPYMTAIEQRLSMDDVTPHGYTVRFDTSGYLRLDDEAAATTDATLVNAKILTIDEARAKRGLEPSAALQGNPDTASNTNTAPDEEPAVV